MIASVSPLSEDVIVYFDPVNMAEENDIPYQSLINLYLRDCVTEHRKLDLSWVSKTNRQCQIYTSLRSKPPAYSTPAALTQSNA